MRPQKSDRLSSRALVLTLLSSSLTAGATSASETWSRFGGPNDDFGVPELALPSGVGAATPLWRERLGPGYSAIVVDGGELYAMTRITGIDAGDGAGDPAEGDRVVALDATDGALRWVHEYPAPTREENLTQFGSGPHASPLLLDDRVITLGYTGHLRALRRRDGKLLWSHRLLEDFDADVLPWGFSASPLLHDGSVIVLVGGPQAVVAFDPVTGERRWSSTAGTVSYSTPRVLTLGTGEQQRELLLYFGKDHLAALDPNGGRELWRFPLRNGYENHASNLLFDGELLWVASQQEAGARALRLVEDGKPLAQPVEIWADAKLRLHHWNAVLDADGVVYGTFGDQGQRLGAVELRTGKIRWQRRSPAMGKPLLTATGPLFLFEDGTLQQYAGDGSAVGESVTVAESDAWTAPTLVDGVLYVRDRETVAAYRLAPEAGADATADAGGQAAQP